MAQSHILTKRGNLPHYSESLAYFPRKVASMIQTVADQASETQFSRISNQLIATLFFFELEKLPNRTKEGKLQCTGNILIRIATDTESFSGLMAYLNGREARFVVGNRSLTKISTSDGMKRRNFRKRISFDVNDAYEKVSFSIIISSDSYEISGFPCSIRSLIKAQGLYSPFGSRHRCSAYHTSDNEHGQKRKRENRDRAGNVMFKRHQS